MTHYAYGGLLIRVGREIKVLRERSNMTQGELAKKLHSKKGIITRIEKGQYNMLLRTLIRMRIFSTDDLKLRSSKERKAYEKEEIGPTAKERRSGI